MEGFANLPVFGKFTLHTFKQFSVGYSGRDQITFLRVTLDLTYVL